jgi:hypothetical protein
VVWSAPALYLLVGASLSQLAADTRMGRFAASLALAVLSLAGLSGAASQMLNPIRPDLRGASMYVTETIQPGDVIVFQIPYSRFGYEYYAQRAGTAIDLAQLVEAPYTNYGMSEDDVAVTLAPALSSARRVWLYEAESEMWDQRRLVRAWFDRDFTLLNRREFRGVSVGLYGPNR